LYKYISNRILTFIQNILMGMKMSEFHTGYRAYSSEFLRKISFEKNSDDFVFDNQLIAQLKYSKARFGEISCPTKYFPEASSINLSRSIKYGLGVLFTSIQYRLQKWKIINSNIFG
jgi:hypothetical protein